MTYPSDHDGKSKTASAVDAKHYPEQHEVQNLELATGLPEHTKIAERAYQIWIQRGRPQSSAEHDWRQAEEELRVTSGTNHVIGRASGSVQS